MSFKVIRFQQSSQILLTENVNDIFISCSRIIEDLIFWERWLLDPMPVSVHFHLVATLVVTLVTTYGD